MAGRKPKSKRKVPKPKSAFLAIQPAWFTNTHLHCFLLFLFGFLLYANTLTHDYALDDAIVIYDNEFTTKGIEGISDILKYDTFRGFFKEAGKDQLVSGGRYRPLTLVMFALEFELFGKSPFVGHMVNVLLYALTGVVLYLLLLKLFSPQGKPTEENSYAYFMALVVTLLFIAHPLHTEVVANIKGRDEIVSLLGSLAAVYFSLRAFYEKKPRWNIAARLMFFFALLSKENAITFLAIFPLTYFFFTTANWKKIAALTIPFMLVAMLFLFMRAAVLGWSFGESSRELMNNPFLKLVGNQYVDFSLAEKFSTISYTLGKYVQLLVFPHPLTHDYYPRQIPMENFGDWKVLLSLLFYLAIGFFGFIRMPRKDPLSYAILFYLATLSIVSNLVVNVGTNMNERFTYMPSIGFCLVLAILGWRFSQRRKPKKKRTNFAQLKPVLALVVLILGFYSFKTVSRNFVWKDNNTLFLTDVKTSSKSAKLQNAAGGELIAQAIKPENADRKDALLQEAVSHLQEAVKIHPAYKNAYLLLGNANNYLKNYEDALVYYQQALQLDPNYREALNNMSITYREAGKYYGEKRGDLQKALQYLHKAYEMRPNEYETLRLLGVAYGQNGDVSKAVAFFQKAVELEPNNADALYNLGSAYHYAGQPEKRDEYIRKAKEINPNIEQERRQQQ